MGCAASTSAGPVTCVPGDTASIGSTASPGPATGSCKPTGCSDRPPSSSAARRRSSRNSNSSNSSMAAPDAAPSPFLEYYTLASLRGRELFGPFLKLSSYNPDTGSLQLSVLVICTEAVQCVCDEQQLRISWWELSNSGEPPIADNKAPLCTTEGARGPRTGAETGAEEETWEAVSEGVEVGGVVGGAGCCGNSSINSSSSRATWDDTAASYSSGVDGGGVGSGGGDRSTCQERMQYQQMDRAAAPPAEAAAGVETASASGEVLYTWRNWRFWKFRFGTKCGPAPKRLMYQIILPTGCPQHRYSIAVPALDEPWRMAFYSCNGLDASHNHPFEGRVAAARALSLWRDLACRHKKQPFHLLLGGGDQIYNDGVFEGPLLKGWDKTRDDRDTAVKAAIPFSEDISREVQEFYFSHYLVHWSQAAYAELFATIPTFNSWDDHDIVDGWGSYHDVINNADIMQGLFRIAQLFYLLFQHHTTLDRLSDEGYWCEPASCALLRLGASVALLAPDTRTCRSQRRILPPSFLQEMQVQLAALPPSVRHVLVLMGGPLVYPRLPVQDTLQKLDDLFTGDTLISIVMQKTGLAAKVTKRFGMVAYLDDIIDQWSANQHLHERDQFLEAIMALSAEKGIRLTFLSGDVHCAGYGMLHSRGGDKSQSLSQSQSNRHHDDRHHHRQGVVALEDMPVPDEDACATDPRFIPQIISSAIVNVPPPGALMKLLCLAARKPQPILEDCVQRMVPLFGPKDDIDSLMLGRRNWCEATLGGPRGHLTFSLRGEKDLGSEEIDVFPVTVPPLCAATAQDE